VLLPKQAYAVVRDGWQLPALEVSR
jgi:hypothetical protein